MISDHALDRLATMFRAPDMTGTRYEIRAELGRGGMGIVYLARDTALDRDVALKIVERAPGQTAGPPAALAHEARILARLEHPGIVPVHDFGLLADGRAYYAMKYVRGERLDRWLDTHGGIRERLAVLLRVCDALAFAHSHGIVHRDLKPQNVMVAAFGEVLVLDWGIAIPECGMRTAECGLPDADAFRTPRSAFRNEEVAGTPEYMAPELLRGIADARSDVFAIGVVLAAFGGPPALAAIARKAQAPEPADRYQRVEDLAADVQRFLEGRAVAAHREPLVDRALRIARRQRLPIVLVLTYLAFRLLLLWLARV